MGVKRKAGLEMNIKVMRKNEWEALIVGNQQLFFNYHMLALVGFAGNINASGIKQATTNISHLFYEIFKSHLEEDEFFPGTNFQL